MMVVISNLALEVMKWVAYVREHFSEYINDGKIYTKYLGTLEYPLAKMHLEHVKKDNSIIRGIMPKFFSTWDPSRYDRVARVRHFL
jgi:hypothetical protein